MLKEDQESRFHAKDPEVIRDIDDKNENKIKQLIEDYGYLTKELIGEKGMFDFWLLVQHADFNLELQENCLKNCDFAPSEYAHLYDRIMVNKGLEQKFGTQMNRPILNLEKTNKARIEIGWTTLEDWIINFNENDDLGRTIVLSKKDDGGAEYIR